MRVPRPAISALVRGDLAKDRSRIVGARREGRTGWSAGAEWNWGVAGRVVWKEGVLTGLGIVLCVSDPFSFQEITALNPVVSPGSEMTTISLKKPVPQQLTVRGGWDVNCPRERFLQLLRFLRNPLISLQSYAAVKSAHWKRALEQGERGEDCCRKSSLRWAPKVGCSSETVF